MAPTTLFDNQGRAVRLGAEIGRGGEAAVYSVEGEATIVAKIYHQSPGPEKAEKLSRMVELQSARLLALAAWPVATLFTPGSRALAGFLMKNVSGFKDLHLLYSPKSRAREFPPKANWRFLIHTAANVARAFSAIHDHGHVIGDVNQSNIRVAPETAIVNLVDCDSFQISANGKLFPCEVGVPLYTPPELQETEFREVVRTPNHDNFGLAVLIFHLLFMGRHPFAGKFLGSGDTSIEQAISEHRFAFAPDVQRTQMLPPPSCITLAHLPEEVGELFISAFGPDGARGSRPGGRQWITALEALASRLIICSINKTHLFFNGLSSCPWCPIESSGVLLFVDFTIVNTGSAFSIETAWAQIFGVPNPGPGNPPSLVTYMTAVDASPTVKAAKWRKRKKMAAVGLVLAALFAVVVLTDNGLSYLLFFGAGFAALMRGVFADTSPGEFAPAARAAEARLRNLQQHWQREASGEEFNVELDKLRALAEEYRQLPARRKQKVRELERALYETQLQRYLEQFDLAAAEIPHIKDGRKAMLSAYGINDAADVTPAALAAVPGFGNFLLSQVLIWKQTLAATFKFNPGQGIDPADLQRVDQGIGKRRAELEALLLRGPSALNEIRRRVVAARGRLQEQLEKAMLEVAQAQADERAAT